MGYRIRNKSVFYTVDGFKNNHRFAILHDYLQHNSAETTTLKVPLDYLSTIRTIQSYRNISRTAKKYFMGDKQAEQKFTVYIKSFFQIPQNCESKIDIVGNSLKRFADQYDRDWELYSYNEHPVMLNMYRENNQAIREQNENEQLRQQGYTPLDDQYRSFVGQKLSELTKLKGKISVEDIENTMRTGLELYYQAKGETNVRDRNGDYNDFLENNRPSLENKGHVETKQF